MEGNGIAIGLVKRNTPNSDNLEIYPAFLSALENETDHILFTSTGVLNYNDAAKEFRISSPEKLINRFGRKWNCHWFGETKHTEL